MEPDVLGPPFERYTIELDPDDEGPVVATLVRRRAERPSRRAVLYLHGFVDYFFQAHLAEFWADRGWDFYALDLRKHGRSLLPYQTPNFCLDLSDYFPELDTAATLIRDRDDHDTLLVMGHSTGGLLAATWAHARRDAGLVDGLLLNSPFFDLKAPWLVRRPLVAAVTRLGRNTPRRVVPVGLGSVNGECLHADRQGEWRYDLGWKPLAGFPVRIGWLAAILRAQRQLRAGLDIQVPVLVACSTRTFRRRRWHASAMLADVVLDVAHMVRWAPRLGPDVTVVRIDGGMHDLTLSGPAVREKVFAEFDRWADGTLGGERKAVEPESGEPKAVKPEDVPPTVPAPRTGAEAPAGRPR